MCILYTEWIKTNLLILSELAFSHYWNPKKGKGMRSRSYARFARLFPPARFSQTHFIQSLALRVSATTMRHGASGLGLGYYIKYIKC